MNKYSGSNLDDFLDEGGLFDEVSERAQGRLLALQIEDVMNVLGKAKSDRRMLNHHLFKFLSRVHPESGSRERHAHPGGQRARE